MTNAVKYDELEPLRRFGRDSDLLILPKIAAGGFIVSGREAAITNLPAKEVFENGKPESEGASKARSAAGTRARRRTRSPAASRTTAHAVERVTIDDVLGELDLYAGTVEVVSSSSRFVGLRINVGLFRSLPYRACLFLEVPLISRSHLRTLDDLALPHGYLKQAYTSAVVPDVRAWSRWVEFGQPASAITTHHEYPDESMCVCMPGQWVRGRHPLIEYVDFSIVWIAKALHLRVFDRYPGPQHYPANRRVERDAADEFCGCGGARSYADCCRAADLRRTSTSRMAEEFWGRRHYVNQLAMQSRTPAPPLFVSAA